MKRFSWLVLFLLLLFVSSCLKEDLKVQKPEYSKFEIIVPDVEGNDSSITEVAKGSTVTLVVYSDADLCSIWPNDLRVLRKETGTEVDSVDMFGHDVLENSNFFADYGLVGARGLKTTRYKGKAWATSYTYNHQGDFDLTAVLTNHGSFKGDFKQVVEAVGVVHVY